MAEKAQEANRLNAENEKDSRWEVTPQSVSLIIGAVEARKAGHTWQL